MHENRSSMSGIALLIFVTVCSIHAVVVVVVVAAAVVVVVLL